MDVRQVDAGVCRWCGRTVIWADRVDGRRVAVDVGSDRFGGYMLRRVGDEQRLIVVREHGGQRKLHACDPPKNRGRGPRTTRKART